MGDVSDERALWLARNVLRHEAALRVFLKRRNVIGLDVDDIVQETYAVLSARASVDDIANPLAYAFQVARSVIATHVRRARIVSIQSVGDVGSLAAASEEPTPEEAVADFDQHRKLSAALAALPPLTRDAATLRIEGGLSLREIGVRLGISPNAAQKHVARAISFLSAAFALGVNGASHASNGARDRKLPSYDAAAEQR